MVDDLIDCLHYGQELRSVLRAIKGEILGIQRLYAGFGSLGGARKGKEHCSDRVFFYVNLCCMRRNLNPASFITTTANI